ncbi:MAG: PmoA family protein, partial [Planctomycetes bacterium]|nr:PmoA family protein [Planctomycetota bacterium]
FDFWHCRQGESQRLLAHTVPPGRPHAQELAIAWCAADGQPIVAELRRVETITTDDVNGVRMTHELRAAAGAGAVTLGGDPQHAGAQFRAVQAFAEADAPKVAYVRPATATGGKDDVWTHCAWTAAVLPFADGPVTVLRVEHPDNPPATWSTRPYGRFGAMWTTTLEPEVPFRVQVAWLVLPGTADVARCERLAAAAFAQ